LSLQNELEKKKGELRDDLYESERRIITYLEMGDEGIVFTEQRFKTAFYQVFSFVKMINFDRL
jgi:hypothetical protein